MEPLPCSVSFPYRFKRPDHIDILELAALTSLVKLLAQKGVRRERFLWCVDSWVVLGAVSKGRSSSRKVHFRLRLLVYHCLSLRRSPSTCSGSLVGKSGGRAVERLSAQLVEKGTPCVACSVVLSMKVTCPPSRAAHSAMWWRLRRSWALAQPWEFCTLVPLSVALASWGGKSCLRWIDIHTFDARQHGDVWTRWCETAKNTTHA